MFTVQKGKRSKRKCVNSDKLMDNNPAKTKNLWEKMIKKVKACGSSGL